jgi:phage repressor protein C with HTH and peptisase S24 domain
MKLSERIKYLIEKKKITPYEVSKKAGISESTLSRILNENTEKLTFNSAAKLANYFHVDLDWLRFGEGEIPKQIKSSTNKIPVIHKVQDNSQSGIPLIPIDAMAGFGTGEQQILEYECERYVVPIFRDAEFLISVRGSSMYPKYSSGDLVACKHVPLEDIFFQWHKVYVLDTDQGALIKRVEPAGDKNCMLLISENEKYKPFELHISQIHAVAIVLGVIRLE